MVNDIVDNAPPSVSITPSWWIWETADAAVYEQIIPLGNISITVECGDLPDRTYDYNPNRGSFTYKWNRTSTGLRWGYKIDGSHSGKFWWDQRRSHPTRSITMKQKKRNCNE